MSEERIQFPACSAQVVCKKSLREELRKIYCQHDWVYDWIKNQTGVKEFQGRRPVLGAKIFGQDCIVKRHYHGGVFAPLTTDRFFGSDRLLNAMKSADYLLEKNILTPEYQFVAWRKSTLWTRYESCVTWITAGVDTAKLFFKYKQEKNIAFIASIAKQVGAFVSKMHQANFYHSDLNLMNFLSIDNKEIAILDLDKCAPPDGPLPDRKKIQNLDRLFRSVRKLGENHPVKYVDTIIQALQKGYEDG